MGIFKGPYHSTLNFFLPTVGCWIVEEFVRYTLKFLFPRMAFPLAECSFQVGTRTNYLKLRNWVVLEIQVYLVFGRSDGNFWVKPIEKVSIKVRFSFSFQIFSFTYLQSQSPHILYIAT